MRFPDCVEICVSLYCFIVLNREWTIVSDDSVEPHFQQSVVDAYRSFILLLDHKFAIFFKAFSVLIGSFV